MLSRALKSVALIALVFVATPLRAADKLRFSVQATGTVSWELAVIKAFGLDNEANIELETSELASTEAGKLALRGGSADMIVSDWLWVARERGLGAKLTFYPHSSALGAVMVKADSPIHSIADLQGKSLGVAGGPLDKSWLMLQAAALKDGIDLKAKTTLSFAAPPLLAEKLGQGEMDASLQFWNFCAKLESAGFTRAIDMAAVQNSLGAKGPVAVTGYVFDEAFAASHADLLARFFTMTRKAKNLIASSDEAFAKVAPLTGTADKAALEIYRKRFAAGIPKRPIAQEEADAAVLYKVLATLGGEQLVGSAKELDAGTFYHGDAGAGAP